MLSPRKLIGTGAARLPYTCDFDGDSFVNTTPGTDHTGGTQMTVAGVFRTSRSGLNQYIYSWHEAGEGELLFLDTSNRLNWRMLDGAASTFELITTATYADGDYHHFVAWCDLANGTQGDRAGIAIDGARVTAFDTETYPATAGDVIQRSFGNAVALNIGRYRVGADSYWQGQLGDINLVNGQKLAATDFGRSFNGGWAWRSYTGTHGNNGVRLQFLNKNQMGANTAN